MLNISYVANTYKPGTLVAMSPSIVCVFPLPVYPYAKHVVFDFLKAASTSGRTEVIYTYSLVDCSSNAKSKLNKLEWMVLK